MLAYPFKEISTLSPKILVFNFTNRAAESRYSTIDIAVVSLLPHLLTSSQILRKELQQLLIPPLILLLIPQHIQPRPSTHPAMNLIPKRLHILRSLERSLEFLHVFSVFIFRSEHAERDVDVSCVGGVDHCRVAFGGGLEGGAGLGGEGNYFAAPA